MTSYGENTNMRLQIINFFKVLGGGARFGSWQAPQEVICFGNQGAIPPDIQRAGKVLLNCRARITSREVEHGCDRTPETTISGLQRERTVHLRELRPCGQGHCLPRDAAPSLNAPLLEASRRGELSRVRELRAKGADANAQTVVPTGWIQECKGGSRYSSMASRIFCRASSLVQPCDQQLFREGHVAV